MKFSAILCAVGMTLTAFAGPAAAQAPGGEATASSGPVAATALSATQREAITRELIAKWGSAVMASLGGSLARWSDGLRSEIASGDAANILRATSAPTLDLMHAALVGYIPTTADIAKAASSVPGSARIGNGTVAPQSLGDALADLVYTPLPNGRCRIADSRAIGNPLPAKTIRSLVVSPASSYTSQGGSGTAAGGNSNVLCGIPSFATSYALSISVLSPQGDGTFRVFTYGQSFQTGPTILAIDGTLGSNNNVIVKACIGCAFDISIRSGVQVAYVVDVIGYFMPPVATALSCVDTANTVVSVAPSATANALAPFCPAGYAQTTTNCESTSWLMPFVFSSKGTCSARNNDTVSKNLIASRTCCRVPGR